MLFSSEVRPDGRSGRTPGGAIGFCRESYGPPHRWRLILFRVLAGLLGLAYLPGVLLFAPWAPLSMARALPNLSVLIGAWAQARHPDLQRFTWRLSAAVDATIAGVLFALAWRPLARPLLLQFLALALVVECVRTFRSSRESSSPTRRSCFYWSSTPNRGGCLRRSGRGLSIGPC